MISTFLDIEASGLQAESYPIEIAWSDTLGNTDSFLIRPDPGWTHWDAMAESIHNIPREKLFQEGISVLDACERLNRSLGCEIVYSDAADFDNAWLQRLYDFADLVPSFVLQDMFSFYQLLPSKQVGLIQHIVSNNPAPHRALPDCQRYATAYNHSQSAAEICRTVLATGIRSVLFICTANIQRSKTCEDLLRDQHPSLQVESAGVSERECKRNSSTLCTEEMLEKADVIFTFEQMHKTRIDHYTSGRFSEKFIELEIPDQYQYMQLELLELITSKLRGDRVRTALKKLSPIFPEEPSGIDWTNPFGIDLGIESEPLPEITSYTPLAETYSLLVEFTDGVSGTVRLSPECMVFYFNDIAEGSSWTSYIRTRGSSIILNERLAIPADTLYSVFNRGETYQL